MLFKSCSLFCVVVLTVAAAAANSAEIVRWGPTGNNNGELKTSGTDADGNTLSIAPGISFIDQGSGTEYALGTGAGFSSSYAGSTAAVWQNDDINVDGFDTTTKALAITDNNYVFYGITSTNDFNVSDIAFDVWRNGGQAADDYAIYYSIDGGSQVQAGTDFTITGTGVDGSGDPNDLATLLASGLDIDLLAGEELELRLFAWVAGQPTGNSHVTGGFVNGTIEENVVPEPSSLAIWAVGGMMLMLLGVSRRFHAPRWQTSSCGVVV